MRFLGALRLLGVDARVCRDRSWSETVFGGRAGGGQCLTRKVGGVGTHVGDIAALVQRLCDAHRGRCVPLQFAGRFLLQGGSDEGRGRPAPVRLLCQGNDRTGGSVQGGGEFSCGLGAQDHRICGLGLQFAVRAEVGGTSDRVVAKRGDLRVKEFALVGFNLDLQRPVLR